MRMATQCHRCSLPAPGDYFQRGWAAPHGGPYWLLCPQCYAGLERIRAKVAAFQSKLMRQYTEEASNQKAERREEMSAINDSLNRLTIALHLLRTAVDECDASRRLPFKPPEPLKSIAEEMCSDADMVDLESAIHFMDRISAQCRVRARHINKMTEAIKEATRDHG